MCDMASVSSRLAAATVVAVILAAPAGAAVPPFVISVSPPAIWLGSYRLDGKPSYAGALAALGRSSSCVLLDGDASHARASWPARGVEIELRTYGGLPAGKTGCTATRVMKIHTVRVTSRRWVTARGLRVGDTVSQLRQRYPLAKRAKPLVGWYDGGYWLVTRHVGGYEGIGGFRPNAPVLVAEIRNGHVAALVLVVGAEGD
jgi:hypothetical protein